MISLRQMGFLVLALWPGLAAAQEAAQVDGVSVMLEEVAGGFDSPIFLTAPAGDARLFVVEKSGRIVILVDGQKQPEPFLDISDKVSGDSEQGLLGLAFHPDYAANGRFFINYTDLEGNTQVVGYTVSGNPEIADPASARPLLSVDQPASNHNGGWLGFGPDGLLYIAMGDGGGAGDRWGNGQNKDALLGKILRIDVDSGSPYGIPDTNPFAKGGGAPEIFLLGLRNPWRVSFDGDDFYIADVGQNEWEEIDVVTVNDAGANLGWNTMEGEKCFNPRSGCVEDGLVLPVHVYSHDEGCSITGGYVYRGKALPALDGRYFFADYCFATISSFRYLDGKATALTPPGELFGTIGPVSSFGVDSAGELYVITLDGVVYQIVPGS